MEPQVLSYIDMGRVLLLRGSFSHIVDYRFFQDQGNITMPQAGVKGLDTL